MVKRGWKMVRKLGPIGLMAGMATALPPLGGLVLLGTSVYYGQWFEAAGAWGLAVFVVALAVLGGLALLPTYAQSVAGGWMFGLAVGLPVCMLGFLGAALLSYVLVVRYSGRGAVEVIEEHPRARVVYQSLARGRFWRTVLVVSLIRLPPNSPFALTNVAMGSLRVPLGCFMMGTAIGMLPRVAVAVAIGAGLSDHEQWMQRGPWMAAAGVVSMLLVLMVLSALAKRALRAMEVQQPVEQGQHIG